VTPHFFKESPEICNKPYRSKCGSGEVVPVHTMMAYRGRGVVEAQINSFLTSALDGREWSASRTDSFTHRERTTVLTE